LVKTSKLVKRRNWDATVSHLKHLGFYRVEYQKDIFEVRPEVGAVGGRVLDHKKRLSGGMMDEEGNVVFQGLRDGFSGYVNRAALTQQALALDVRCMRVNPACRTLAEAVLAKYVSGKTAEIAKDGTLVWKSHEDSIKCSLELSMAVRNAGYVLIWDPQWCKR